MTNDIEKNFDFLDDKKFDDTLSYTSNAYHDDIGLHMSSDEEMAMMDNDTSVASNIRENNKLADSKISSGAETDVTVKTVASNRTSGSNKTIASNNSSFANRSTKRADGLEQSVNERIEDRIDEEISRTDNRQNPVEQQAVYKPDKQKPEPLSKISKTSSIGPPLLSPAPPKIPPSDSPYNPDNKMVFLASETNISTALSAEGDTNFCADTTFTNGTNFTNFIENTQHFDYRTPINSGNTDAGTTDVTDAEDQEFNHPPPVDFENLTPYGSNSGEPGESSTKFDFSTEATDQFDEVNGRSRNASANQLLGGRGVNSAINRRNLPNMIDDGDSSSDGEDHQMNSVKSLKIRSRTQAKDIYSEF